MSILPDDLVARIPPLHTQDSLPDAALTAYARLTLTEAGLTWFLLELHDDQDTFSGYLIDPKQEQFGYFSFAYLEEHLGTAAWDVLAGIPGEGFLLGLSEVPSGIAYDASFSPKSLLDAVKEERVQRLAKGKRFRPDAPLSPHRAYYQVARYPSDATQVYQAIREIVFKQPVNLSVFQVPPTVLSSFWHIVVIGDRPAEAVHEQIMHALAGGTMTTIPYDLLMQLFARKVEENQKGPWREHHRTIRLKKKPKRPKQHKRDPRHRRGH